MYGFWQRWNSTFYKKFPVEVCIIIQRFWVINQKVNIKWLLRGPVGKSSMYYEKLLAKIFIKMHRFWVIGQKVSKKMCIMCFGGGPVVQNWIYYKKLQVKIFIRMHRIWVIGQKVSKKCVLCVLEVARLSKIKYSIRNYKWKFAFNSIIWSLWENCWFSVWK